MLTSEQYTEHKERNARHDAWAQQYVQKNGWTVIPAGVQPPPDAAITNEERGEIELYEFVNDPPSTYFLYVNETTRNATAWPGQVLGSVSFGREYRDNFGGRRVPVRIQAVNGRTYAGTYYKSAGDYARVRMVKSTARNAS